jgi:hypothetical protein
VDEAVGDGGRCGGVMKELAPLLEWQIRGHDGRSALVPAVEDLVEEVGAAGVEAELAELSLPARAERQRGGHSGV